MATMTSDGIEVLGTPVRFPVAVRDGSAGSAAFPAHAGAVARLLPDGLVPVQIAPGVALAMLAMVDYRDNDLGDYDEAAVVFPCAPTAGGMVGAARAALAGRAGGYIHRLPVTQEFTCAAGRQLWGYPKTVDQVSLDVGERRTRCTWRADGEFVWELVVPRGQRIRQVPPRAMATYSVLDGRVVATEFRAGGSGVRVGRGGRVTLGDHPAARELATVLRSRRPLWTMWIEHVEATFGAPQLLA
jgi:hypothetical protein